MSKKFLNRLFYPKEIILNNLITLDKEQSHYLSRVLKCQLENYIIIFNPIYGEFSGKITDISKNSISIKICEKLRNTEDYKYKLNLYLACVKPDKMKLILEKAIELGITGIYILKTDFSFHNFNAEKLNKIIIEAAEQCERIKFPLVEEKMLKLREVIQTFAEEEINLFADERRIGKGLINLVNELEHSYKKYNLIIGPEGGFSQEERKLLDAQKNIYNIKLNNYILRTETAVISGLAILSNYLS